MAAYPDIFNLLEANGNPPTAEMMATLTSLPLQERPALRIIVNGSPRHPLVLWVIKKLPFYYSNKTALGRHIVTFSHDIVSEATYPTITINLDWWDLKDHPVVSPITAATKVEKLLSSDSSIDDVAVVVQQANILLELRSPFSTCS